jgi:hypothetical protein
MMCVIDISSGFNSNKLKYFEDMGLGGRIMFDGS